MTSDFLFYLLTAVAAVFAIATVTTKHILRSVTYLMGVLCLSAGFYVLLGAELLAGVQILVYVGGIVVLLVIAVMLTQSNALDEDHSSLGRTLGGLAASVTFFVGSVYALSQSPLADQKSMPPAQFSVKAMGLAFLDTGANGYVLPFEVISLLLLAVLVAGIVIAKKETA